MGADSDLTQRGAKLETGAVGSIQVQDQARARSNYNGTIEFYALTQEYGSSSSISTKEKVRRHVMELLVA